MVISILQILVPMSVLVTELLAALRKYEILQCGLTVFQPCAAKSVILR